MELSRSEVTEMLNLRPADAVRVLPGAIVPEIPAAGPEVAQDAAEPAAEPLRLAQRDPRDDERDDERDEQPEADNEEPEDAEPVPVAAPVGDEASANSVAETTTFNQLDGRDEDDATVLGLPVWEAVGIGAALAAVGLLAITNDGGDTPGNAAPPGNVRPLFTSDDAFDVEEGATAVGTVMAVDPDSSGALVYSISGGADASLFQIDEETGALSFVDAPAFDPPGDNDEDNVYEVTVRANDGQSFRDQDVMIAVTEMADGSGTTTDPMDEGQMAAGDGETGDPMATALSLMNEPEALAAVDVDGVGEWRFDEGDRALASTVVAPPSGWVPEYGGALMVSDLEGVPPV